MTFAEVAAFACVKNGLLASGEDLPSELADEALSEGNILLDEMNITPSVMIWTQDIIAFPMTALVLPITYYTIGPNGADFTAARPVDIKRANLLLTGSTPMIRIKLEIVNDLQEFDISTPNLDSAPYPVKLYNDGGFPNSKLYLWPVPTVAGNSLELLLPHQVAAFTDVTDTFSFPPGFLGAYSYTLSERLCEGKREIPATLGRMAARMRNAWARINRTSPKMSTVDSGIPNSDRGSFYTGWM